MILLVDDEVARRRALDEALDAVGFGDVDIVWRKLADDVTHDDLRFAGLVLLDYDLCTTALREPCPLLPPPPPGVVLTEDDLRCGHRTGEDLVARIVSTALVGQRYVVHSANERGALRMVRALAAADRQVTRLIWTRWTREPMALVRALALRRV